MTARTPLGQLALWLIERVYAYFQRTPDPGPRGRVYTREGDERVGDFASGTWLASEM